jgi:hypothetical protein
VQLSNVNGIEGQVTLVGYKAVVAMFLRWSLERRGDKGSATPSWTLRAVLSFQKDGHLLNDAMKKAITVKLNGSEWLLEPLPGAPIKIEQNRLIVEGVTLVKQDGNRV